MNGNLRRLSIVALLVLSQGAWANIATSKHNLTPGGPGAYKATGEQQVCVFCHTPHNAKPANPLWNHLESGAVYTPYSSQSLAAAPGQPTGSSRLCLSCHDGMVAVGSVHNLRFGGVTGTTGVVSGLEATLSGPASLSTDLSDDHPVSFVYDAALASQNLELAPPSTLGTIVRPDYSGQVQCTSCHDPHDNTYPKFLLMDFTDAAGFGSPLCRTCHTKKYWSSVVNQGHRDSIAQWNGAGVNPWHLPGHNLPNDPNSTPRANGCESCHQPHSGGGGRVLLKQDGESGVCLVCHNGNVATVAKNIATTLTKIYTHPISDPTYSGRHTIARIDANTVRETQANLANRHAECPDCHNPHAVSPGVSPSVGGGLPTNNLASNVLKGIWGVEPIWPAGFIDVTNYTVVNDVQYQYQLCFKCHSYYAFGLTPPTDPYGLLSTNNLLTDQAKEFNPNNASYHPVVAAGKNTFTAWDGVDYSASLINGMTPTSTMTCAECHSDGQGIGGQKGPHGSDVWPILGAPYDWTTGMTGTSTHLCYKCHDWGVYGGGTNTSPNSTGFSGRGVATDAQNLHNRHAAVRNMPCFACHAAVPHGWQRRAMLVFGTGTPDPEPYNAHKRYPGDAGSTLYGINSGVPVDTIQSGNWKKSDCHSAADPGTSGITGVGACSTIVP